VSLLLIGYTTQYDPNNINIIQWNREALLSQMSMKRNKRSISNLVRSNSKDWKSMYDIFVLGKG